MISIPSTKKNYILEYQNIGDFKMGCDSFDLCLNSSNGDMLLDYFKNKTTWVGGVSEENCPHYFDENEDYLIIPDNHNATYVYDIKNKLISLRWAKLPPLMDSRLLPVRGKVTFF